MLARILILLVLAAACVLAGVGIAFFVAGLVYGLPGMTSLGVIFALLGFMTIDMIDGIYRWMGR